MSYKVGDKVRIKSTEWFDRKTMVDTEGMNAINDFFVKISTLNPAVIVAAVVAVLAMAVIFSLGISIGIMKKKEF